MSDEELREMFAGLDGRLERLETGVGQVRVEIGEAVEAMKDEVQLVAEAVLDTRQEMLRRFDYLDGKIDRDIAETRALMKFGYEQLDRRVTALEQK